MTPKRDKRSLKNAFLGQVNSNERVRLTVPIQHMHYNATSCSLLKSSFHRFIIVVAAVVIGVLQCVTYPYLPTHIPNLLFRSSRIRVDLLSYESKITDKRDQYDWRAETNLDGWPASIHPCMHARSAVSAEEMCFTNLISKSGQSFSLIWWPHHHNYYYYYVT